jgi:hypothetical protein
MNTIMNKLQTLEASLKHVTYLKERRGPNMQRFGVGWDPIRNQATEMVTLYSKCLMDYLFIITKKSMYLIQKVLHKEEITEESLQHIWNVDILMNNLDLMNNNLQIITKALDSQFAKEILQAQEFAQIAKEIAGKVQNSEKDADEFVKKNKSLA